MVAPLESVDSTEQAPPTMDGWERRLNRVWDLLLAGTLAVPTAIALFADDSVGTDGQQWLIVGLSLGFAAWHWTIFVRHPQWWGRVIPMIGYWTVAVAFTVALAGQSESYTILLYGLYPLMFLSLGWWAIGLAVVVTALVGWQLDAGDGGGGGWLNLLATAGLASLIGFFVTAIGDQSDRRRAALETLAATRKEMATIARHAGMLEERQRLAREIHDTVAQEFISVVTQLEAADQALSCASPDIDAVRGRIDVARRTARESLGEIRRSVQALRPDLLSESTLGDALARTCARWSADTGILGELRCTGTPLALHPDAETALLRVTQEALANVVKHASATRVTVTLSYLDDTVTLDIDDDGTGFDDHGARDQRRPDGGFGLTGMRERVIAVGGTLDVESALGRGTTVVAAVPV